MPPEILKLLVDIRKALKDITEFTAGMDYAAYQRDAKCRAAVERKFEIIGEACTRLRDRFPEPYMRRSDPDHKSLAFEIASSMDTTTWMTRSYGMCLPANCPSCHRKSRSSSGSPRRGSGLRIGDCRFSAATEEPTKSPTAAAAQKQGRACSPQRAHFIREAERR
jgi:hypothetical protein